MKSERLKMRIGKVLRTYVVTALLPAGIAIGVPASRAASLTSPERALVSFIDAHNAEALALLERVVNVNSGTHNPAGVRKVGEVFQEALDRLGFRTRWIDGSDFGRAGHLVADHSGAGPRLVLVGHLDTVFESDSPFQTVERLSGTMARGPGIIDMKGGDVIIVSALKALDAAGILKTMNIVVVMNGDEEDPGHPLSRSREALVAAAKNADVAIGFEDGDGDARHAIVARRGSTSWRISVTGKPAHSSQIFREDIGAGAIFEAARILDAFREQLRGEAHLTFSPGTILGGTTIDFDPAAARGSAFGKTNVIAEHAEVSGDLRALTHQQFEKAKAGMRGILGASLPHTEARIVFDEGYPPLAPSDGNARLLALYDRASMDLGFGPVTATDPDKAGAADVAYLAGEVPMILDGVGLKGKGGHTVGETADLETLPMQTKRAALLLYRLSQRPRRQNARE